MIMEISKREMNILDLILIKNQLKKINYNDVNNFIKKLFINSDSKILNIKLLNYKE